MKLHFSRMASKFVLDVSKHGWIRPIQVFSLSQFSRCFFHPFQVHAFRQEIFSIGRQLSTKGHLWPPSIKTPHLPPKTVTTGIQTLTVFNCRSWCQKFPQCNGRSWIHRATRSEVLEGQLPLVEVKTATVVFPHEWFGGTPQLGSKQNKSCSCQRLSCLTQLTAIQGLQKTLPTTSWWLLDRLIFGTPCRW